MDTNIKTREEKIDLKDLCLFVMYKWRVLLAAIFIFGCFFGVYAIFFAPKVSSIDLDTIQRYEDEIAANDKQLTEKRTLLERYQQAIANYQDTIQVAEDVAITCQQALSDVYILQNEYTFDSDETKKLEIIDLITQLNGGILEAKALTSSMDGEMSLMEEQVYLLQTSIDELEKNGQKLQENMQRKETESETGAIIETVLLGAMIGGILSGAWIVFQYFSCNTFKRAEEFKERYGYRILGNLHVEEKKHNILDRMLDNLSGKSFEVDEKEELDIIAAGIHLKNLKWSNESGSKAIMFVGTNNDTAVELTGQKLSKWFEGYSIFTTGDLLRDSVALRYLENYLVIIVGELGVSKKEDMDQTVEILQEASVAGVIIV